MLKVILIGILVILAVVCLQIAGVINLFFFLRPSEASKEEDTKTEEPVETVNELDAYRPGGELRLSLNLNPQTLQEVQCSLIANRSSCFINDQLFHEDSEFGAFLKENNAKLEYVDLLFTETEVEFISCLANAPVPSHAYRYTYNELIEFEDEDEDDITLTEEELSDVRRMTLSNLADMNPNVFMQNGHIRMM